MAPLTSINLKKKNNTNPTTGYDPNQWILTEGFVLLSLALQTCFHSCIPNN